MAAISFRSKADQRRSSGGFDPWMVIFAGALIGIGLLAIFSTGMGGSQTNFKKQVFNVLLGLVPAGIFAFVHPKTWLRMVNTIYTTNLVLLALVLVKGSTVKGAERWINFGPLQFQPSELSKILLVLTLASFYAARREEIHKFSTFALSILHILPPAVLILMQPHLGATLVVISVWLAISLVAGVPGKFVASVVGGAAILATLVLAVPPVRNFVLRDYQKQRVEAMLTKGQDKKGRNYHSEQSKIAFGVGGLTGKGFGHGERKAGKFIPEQDTDFIFSVIGEEFGLFGCTLVLLLFGGLFQRIWLGMIGDYEPFYQMIAAGSLTVLAFHTVVNIGMVLEILPVVGLWLPFLSRGGTAIWLCMSLVGLMLNVRSKEQSVLYRSDV